MGGPPHGYDGKLLTPSWAWISLALLENSLLEPGASCDGEPAPDRVVPAILEDGLMTPDIANGDLPLGASSEERLVAVCGEVERAWLLEFFGGKPKFKGSDLVLDIIDYSSDCIVKSSSNNGSLRMLVKIRRSASGNLVQL